MKPQTKFCVSVKPRIHDAEEETLDHVLCVKPRIHDAENETSDHVLCVKPRIHDAEDENHVLREWEALDSLRRTYLGSFFLDIGDIKGLSLRNIWFFN